MPQPLLRHVGPFGPRDPTTNTGGRRVQLIRIVAITVVGVAATACIDRTPVEEIASTNLMVDDTLAVSVRAPQSLSRQWSSDVAESVWTPTTLSAIRRLGVGANVLVATDGREVAGFLLTQKAPYTVGSNGAGPGEFQRIASLTVDSMGRVLIIDPVQGRVLAFDSLGATLPSDSRQMAVASDWSVYGGIPSESGRVGDVVVWNRGVISVDGLEDSTHVVRLVDTGRVEHIFEVPEGPWASIGGFPAKRDAFGPRALVSIDETDGVAVSDGVDYKIRWWRPGRDPEFLQIVRSWQPASAQNDLEPSAQLLDELGPGGQMLRTVAEGQSRGEFKNAIDHLALVGQQRLLVKVVDSTARYHPYFLGRLPELRPQHWTWEVYSGDGELLGQLRIVSTFTPHRLKGCLLWGVSEGEDGTQSIARIDLRDACGWVVGPRT